MPWDGGRVAPAVDDEVVALRLARDGGVDGGLERRVVLAGAQRRAEVGRVLLAEAHVERAGAGQPHPVAGLAEVMRERRDEADAPAGLGAVHVARRAARRVRALGQGDPKSGGCGKRVSVRVYLGGRRIFKKKKIYDKNKESYTTAHC